MIRIARGPEPEALRSERDKRLAQAILARSFGEEFPMQYVLQKKPVPLEAGDGSPARIVIRH